MKDSSTFLAQVLHYVQVKIVFFVEGFGKNMEPVSHRVYMISTPHLFCDPVAQPLLHTHTLAGAKTSSEEQAFKEHHYPLFQKQCIWWVRSHLVLMS